MVEWRREFHSDFEDFINHDMDAVVLANYANNHVPFAIRCLRRGLHVFSEVLPCQTMKEAIELIEECEKSDKIYAYGENYCYMPATYEMKKLYKAGKIGEFEYGEGEDIHNCDSIWTSLTYGDENHWRNNMYSTFYCTHSLGPLIHITGLRPVSVTGFEGTRNERKLKIGDKGASFGIEEVLLENGGIVKSIHGGLYKNSVWYTVYGSKGRMESAREDSKAGDVSKIYVNADEYEGEYGEEKLEAYSPLEYDSDISKYFGHSGSDYYCMDMFIRKIMGDKDADIIDVYEAMDMFLPGMFAFRSILNGGKPTEIPNMRDKSVRDKFRNDTMCTDPQVAGDMLLPTFSKGTPKIPKSVYEEQKRQMEKGLFDNDYFIAATTNGKMKE